MLKKLLGIALSSVFAMSVVPSASFAKEAAKMDKKVEVKKTDAKMDKKTDAKKPVAQKMEMKKMELVNINTATEEQLKKIPGVGDKIAKAIVEARKKVGKFKKLEDLKSVKGIGDKSFEKMKKALSL